MRGRTIALDRPVIFGILNVTPDSFSDGGKFFSEVAAVARAGELLAEGADILDIGGESTRPHGAREVSAGEERRRVVPVIEAVLREHPDAIVSVDTVKSEVAAAALDAGAAIVNDVSGFRLDPGMPALCAEREAGVVLMHSRGGVADMATFAQATYGDDIAREVRGELLQRVRVAEGAGVARVRIAVDPGAGFSKRSAHTIAVLAELPALVACGYPVLVGVSRKRFIGEITGVNDPVERLYGSVGANAAALALGARLFRVHDVRATRHALDVAWAILRASQPA